MKRSELIKLQKLYRHLDKEAFSIAYKLIPIRGYWINYELFSEVKFSPDLKTIYVFTSDRNSIEFPSSYLWTRNWKSLELKAIDLIHQESLKRAKEYSEQREGEEHILYLKLKEKYEK